MKITQIKFAGSDGQQNNSHFIFIIIIWINVVKNLKSFPYLNNYQKFGNVHIIICNCHSDYISIVRFICKQEINPPPFQKKYKKIRSTCTTKLKNPPVTCKHTSQDLIEGLQDRHIQAPSPCSSWRQNAGLRGRITFKAKYGGESVQRLLWSLLFEQSNPTFEMMKEKIPTAGQSDPFRRFFSGKTMRIKA